MAPKKSRAQASSSQPPSSQPGRTGGRKRKASDTSNMSDIPNSQASAASATTTQKKRKRGRPATSERPEQPQVIEETEEIELVQAPGELECEVRNDDTIAGAEVVHAADDYSIEQNSKHVHFGAGEDTNEEHTTATNITPHPRKMTIKRRVSTSPSALDGTGSKRIKISSSRPSLPLSLSQSQDNNEEPSVIIKELQFAPLRAVLDERVRRRLRRSHLSEEQNAIEEHEKRDSRTQRELEQLRRDVYDKEQRIKDLTFDLETQRQFAMEVSDEDAAEHDRTRAMEQELAELKHEAARSRSLAEFGGAIDDDQVPDEDMLVLHDSQEQVMYPSLPTPESQRIVPNGELEHPEELDDSVRLSQAFGSGASQVTVSRSRWENERKKFEDAVVSLSREANEAKAALQVLTIELEALGFAEEGADTMLVMQSIRHAFDRIREDLESALPGSLPDEASTADLVAILIANVKEFAQRLRIQDQELQGKTELASDLGNQVDGLLDHLADKEIRNNQLQGQWQELDKNNEGKDRRIEELEQELDVLLNEREDAETQLVLSTRTLKTVTVERNELAKNLEKLSTTLQHYRDEETRLTQLITRMEEAHSDDVRKMNMEREETVRELESQVGTLTEAKEVAEDLSDERRRAIGDLEEQIEVIKAERDDLNARLEAAITEKENEETNRSQVEAELEERMSDIEELEQRVSNLEGELDVLNDTLEELRKLNDNERQQREAAEQDLDDRNVEIDELNKKLTDLGKEANELRMKIWGQQQEHDARVRELEEQMSERDQQFQSDMSTEVGRRESAEQLAQERAATILDLEKQLEELEQDMQVQLTERDERIAALEDEVSDKEHEITGLKQDLQDAQNRQLRDAQLAAQRQEELEGSVVALQQTIDEHEVTLLALRDEMAREVDLHNSEIEDRNDTIARLNAEIVTQQAQIEELQRLRDGLEKRVEEEAEQMLQLQSDKDDEIDALRTIIEDKQAKILAVEEAHAKADQAWQDVLDARDEEIANLKTASETTTRTMTAIRSESIEIKRRFREYVRRSLDTHSSLRAELARVKDLADEEGEDLQGYGERELEEIEAMDAVSEVQTVITETTQTKTSSAAAAKKSKGRKKRVVDSGIGLDGEGEESLLAL